MTCHARRLTRCLALITALSSAGVGSVVAAELMGTNSDWRAYRHGAGAERLCFAVTEASEQTGLGGKRGKAHVYVTAWPDAGVKAEISVLEGTDLKKDSEVTIEVGGATFTLFADGDRAFLGDANDEQKLLEAMRRGSSMTVSAVAASGQTLSDTFSLSGVTASVQAVASGCN